MKRSEIVCRHIRLAEYALAWTLVPYEDRPKYSVEIRNEGREEFVPVLVERPAWKAKA